MDNSTLPCAVFSAYLIAFRKKPKVVCYAHESLFKILVNDSLIENAEKNKLQAENKWVTTAQNERKVQFVELEDYIFARLACKPNTLQFKLIHFTLKQNDQVEIVINFPAVLEQYKYKNDLGEQLTLPRKYLSVVEKIQYATRKLSEIGITFDQVDLTDNDNRTIYFRKNNKTISLLSYEVRVIANVVEPQLLLQAYNNGIGRRKTWGFGMLRITKLDV